MRYLNLIFCTRKEKSCVIPNGGFKSRLITQFYLGPDIRKRGGQMQPGVFSFAILTAVFALPTAYAYDYPILESEA